MGIINASVCLNKVVFKIRLGQLTRARTKDKSCPDVSWLNWMELGNIPGLVSSLGSGAGRLHLLDVDILQEKHCNKQG